MGGGVPPPPPPPNIGGGVPPPMGGGLASAIAGVQLRKRTEVRFAFILSLFYK